MRKGSSVPRKPHPSAALAKTRAGPQSLKFRAIRRLASGRAALGSPREVQHASYDAGKSPIGDAERRGLRGRPFSIPLRPDPGAVREAVPVREPRYALALHRPHGSHTDRVSAVEGHRLRRP